MDYIFFIKTDFLRKWRSSIETQFLKNQNYENFLRKKKLKNFKRFLGTENTMPWTLPQTHCIAYVT